MATKPKGRPPSAKTLVDRQLGRNIKHPVIPAGEGFVIPNHSGDHSEGRVDKTPTADLDLVNKLYVDGEITGKAWLQAKNQTGLTGNKTGSFDLTTSGTISLTNVGSNIITATNAGGDLRFGAGGGTNDLQIDTDGNVHIFEDLDVQGKLMSVSSGAAPTVLYENTANNFRMLLHKSHPTSLGALLFNVGDTATSVTFEDASRFSFRHEPNYSDIITGSLGTESAWVDTNGLHSAKTPGCMLVAEDAQNMALGLVFSYGNGDQLGQGVRQPRSGNITSMSIQSNTSADTTGKVEMAINGGGTGGNYQVSTGGAANSGNTLTFTTPLAFNAGDRISFECVVAPTGVTNGTVMACWIVYD